MAWLWGIGRGVWENGRPVGICQNVWGDASGVWPYGGTAETYGEMACVGGRRIAWGSRENVWEMPQDMGNGAGIWGGRQAAWGAKTTSKPGIWERLAVGGLCTFSRIFVGTTVLSGRPLKCMGVNRTRQYMSRQMRPADFVEIKDRRIVWGSRENIWENGLHVEM